MQERIIAPQRFKSSLLVWENLTQRRKVVLFSINMASHAREGYKVYINSAFQRCEGCKAIVM